MLLVLALLAPLLAQSACAHHRRLLNDNATMLEVEDHQRVLQSSGNKNLYAAMYSLVQNWCEYQMERYCHYDCKCTDVDFSAQTGTH